MYIIDVEASGLSDQSYPIQIGWQHRGDLNRFGEILICPHPDWVYWDESAEKRIHHISRQQLLSGEDIVDACHFLNKTFERQPVYSDCNSADGFWVDKLFTTAHVEQRFEIKSIYDLISDEKMSSFKQKLMARDKPHTALADARIISDVVNFFVPY